ncbi:MAG: hypothetical protein KGS72_17690 [Cyanobacteria bacterium REEB67]|nr:hypothetical protein [Cyanobacteria bacterium REEB67]
MNRNIGLKNHSRNQSRYQSRYKLRNQHGLALWLKIVIGLFATGLVIAIAVGIIAFSFVKDAMDPQKTQAVANKIVTLADPLPAPFEYGRMNISLAGYSVALINNIDSKALYILMRIPQKDATTSAQKLIDAVAKGDSMPTAGASPKGTSATKMQVEKQGELDVADSKMYYVLGKAAKTATAAASGTATATSGPAVETFFGAADPKNAPNTTTLIMVQQQDETKHLTLEEIQNFLKNIKSL